MTPEEVAEAGRRITEGLRTLAASRDRESAPPATAPNAPVPDTGSRCGWYVPDERERWETLTAEERLAELREEFGARWSVLQPIPPLCGLLDLDLGASASCDEWPKGRRPPGA